MCVQTLAPEVAIEGFNIGVVRGFSWSAEVKDDIVGISPQIEVARDELATIVDPDRLGIANFGANPLKRLHDILSFVAEPRVSGRRETGIGVNDRQNSEFASSCQLVMNEVHRPDLIGVGRL